MSTTASTTAFTRSGRPRRAGRRPVARDRQRRTDADATTPTRAPHCTIGSTPRRSRAPTPSHFSPIALSVRGTADQRRQRHRPRRVRQPIQGAAHHFRQGTYSWSGPRAGDARLEQEGVHRGAHRIQRSELLWTTTSTRRRTCTRRTTASAASIRSTTTCCVRRMLSSACPAFYNAQCCGIAFEYQTYNSRPAARSADPVRPPLLPVVHARRPRQLLALQRRARAACRGE